MSLSDITVDLNAETWTYPEMETVVVVCWIDDCLDPQVIVKEAD